MSEERQNGRPAEVKIYDPAREATPEDIRNRLLGHIKYTCYKDWRTATDFDKRTALSHVARDYAASRMIATQRTYLDQDVKRLYYLSLEFLIGQLLKHNLQALGILDHTREALTGLDIDLDALCDQEPDAGLGNGGLGRLAACFLESLATLELPGYGYGLRYEHGMFRQEFEDGWQVEKPDDWLRYGNAWEVVRPEYAVPVLLYGRVERAAGPGGEPRPVWTDWQMIEGIPHDIGVIGHGRNTVNLLRLWASRAAEGFRLDVFNRGEYVKAVETENWAETISKVLYPSDSVYAGKELRLIQEYFLCSCTIRDVIRRYRKRHRDWALFARRNAIQMNDTHPALAVVELMRFFLDEAGLPWETAWDITVRTFGYTNHTLLPEAIERWPVDLLHRVLPRHLELIFDINARFLEQVEARWPGDGARLERMSLVEESPQKQVRMMNLAIVGSHSVNGVSALHTDLLRQSLASDFVEFFPGRFNSKTNGITHRRWLLQCNPELANLLTEKVGEDWVYNLDAIRGIEPAADDPGFREAFRAVKNRNKVRLANFIRRTCGESVDPDSLFDVQIKRLHEYKRQLLNAMHIIALFHRVKADPDAEVTPRTFLFGAKAAPSYHHAKRIIKLINTLGRVINADPDVAGRIKVVFLPDYRVSLAELIIPAADLSEQISMAGMEASGTGNMKLSLNGALTIGTWDGANIEIAEAVGEEQILLFGHRADELAELREEGHYAPREWLDGDDELAAVVDAIRHNTFDRAHPDLFAEIARRLVEDGDPYFHIADFRAYADRQAEAARLFADPAEWDRKAILNVARMGWFSSDRTITEYNRDIWRLPRVPIEVNGGGG